MAAVDWRESGVEMPPPGSAPRGTGQTRELIERADLLVERGVPFVFTTGYEESIIPNRFADIPRCEKPINITKITGTLGRVIHG